MFLERPRSCYFSTGGHLRFGADSDWVPESIRTTLRTGLETILSTDGSTAGVNVQDFYHAHLVILGLPNPPGVTNYEGSKRLLPTYLRDMRTDVLAAEAKAYGYDSEFRTLTQQNLEAYRAAVTGTLPLESGLLKAVSDRHDAFIIFHTREDGSGAIQSGSPKRNFIAPVGGATAPYSPPDIADANSFKDNYAQTVEITFLIDQSGVIHVRPQEDQLQTITGPRRW